MVTSSFNSVVNCLANAPIGEVYVVTQVSAPIAHAQLQTQLEDIGFLPGEVVSVLAHAMPGRDPLVVRIGMSTFALRCAEASCIQVTPFEADAL